ncbi:Transcription factor EB [Paragonimus heterotremus]|uniref:Transcription factor EB n=1 Tax=Paragonimus heterotremus TaxID=100268 RepID=A0A8J4T6E3_9TREM|nr:Transcription factor EB [Paragonimus heterotremus]
MLSRTSARQQRMRQQTLNEERMSQTASSARPPGERRSSGSKLIISSPTPSFHFLNNHSQLVNHSTPNIDSTSKAPLAASRGSGSSALLAFLSGSDQCQMPVLPTTTSSDGSHPPTSNPHQEPSTLRTTSHQLPSRSQSVLTPVTLGNLATVGRGSLPSDSGSGKALDQYHASHGSTIVCRLSSSTVKPGRDVSVSNLAPLTVEHGIIEMDSNSPPVSSDPNSPMESCFANIVEEQGSDSFDLNNITPSIQLSSSVNVSDDLFSYPRQITSTSDRLRPVATAAGQPQLSTRIQSNEQDTTRLCRVNSQFRDDLHIKASTSCPAEMPETTQTLGVSPNQMNPYCTQLGGHSESGSSPVGISSTDGIGGGNLSSSLVGTPTSMLLTMGAMGSRGSDDPQTAWIRDRTKKDSHNRIERKRRDYINCQISELGNLLPDEMFRDGDCKKNKGNILKNSVELICMLRAELAQIPEVRRETDIAAKVIGQLMKRIQELEALSSQQHQMSSGSMDYQRSLHEWSLLHEHNLQYRSSLSPLTKPGLLQPCDIHGSSSPGLSSSVGTEDFLSTDNKSVFSSPGLIACSAPVPSAPLVNCSRLNSPISSGALISRGANAADSPLRIMRTRCTSLTVTGPGVNSTGIDYGCSPGAVRLPATDLQTQHALLRNQRILVSQHMPASSRSTQVVQQTLPDQSAQPGRGCLLPSQPRPWLQQTTSYVQNQVSPQYSVTQQRQIHGANMEHAPSSRSGLSASLPVNVNPLLCGLQDQEDYKTSDISELPLIYSLERDEFVPPLKTEPPSDADSRFEQKSYCDPGPRTLNISSTQFEALLDHCSIRARHGARNAPLPIDSLSQTGLEPDEFRFDDDDDDVAME